MHYSWEINGYRTPWHWPTPEAALAAAFDHSPDATAVTIHATPANHDMAPKACAPIPCPSFEETTLEVDPEPVRPGLFGISVYHTMTRTEPPTDVDPRHVMILPRGAGQLDVPCYPKTPAEAAFYAVKGARFVYGGEIGDFENATALILLDAGHTHLVQPADGAS